MQQTAQQHMLDDYGDEVVTLASSNSYSYDKKEMKFSEYVQSMNMRGIDSVNKDDDNQHDIVKNANETYYMFGDNYNGIWKELANMYTMPPCLGCADAGLSTIGVGGKYSGVAFHMHG